MSAKLRLTLYFTLMVLLLAALVLVYIVFVNRSAISDDPASRLVQVVLHNADEVEFDHGRFDWDDLDAYRRGVYCCFYNGDGELIQGAQKENWLVELPFEANIIRSVDVEGEEIFVYDAMVDMRVSEIWIRGMVSSQDSSGLAQTLVVVSIALLPIILILSTAGGWFIARSVFRPIERTIEAANSISDGEDLSARLDMKRGPSEMRRLARSFDKMFERLEQSFLQERQFSSDASHELRTPITVILAQCDRAKRKDETKEDFLRSIEVIEEQGNKMASLVHSLLSLTRLSQGTERYPMEKGDLSALVEGCCEAFVPADYRDISFEKSVEPEIECSFNPELISRLVQNLLENAYKYGRPGGYVKLSLCRAGEQAVLSVEDNGIGISSENLPKVWQRFWQADSSRSEDGGCGLGLAMVRQIAQIHGGSAEVESGYGKGSRFEISLPLHMDAD